MGLGRLRHVPVDGRRPRVPWELLVKDVPEQYHHDLDYLVDQLDWEKNVDPEFKAHNYLEPIVRSGSEAEGAVDRWIVYGTVDGKQLFSACELTVLPGRSITLRDPGAYGLIVVQGSGTIGALDVDSPNFIRFGEVTKDEVFVTAKRAAEGVSFKNTGSEPFVSLRYFGPDTHANLPAVGDHRKVPKCTETLGSILVMRTRRSPWPAMPEASHGEWPAPRGARMITWTLILFALVLVLGGLFAVLVIFSLSRSATGGDLDWQIARLDRKVDLILTHLGIGHDDHVPERVITLAREGRIQEAVEEYCPDHGIEAVGGQAGGRLPGGTTAGEEAPGYLGSLISPRHPSKDPTTHVRCALGGFRRTRRSPG